MNLIKSLKTFGNHLRDCAHYRGAACSCGWQQVIDELQSLQREYPELDDEAASGIGVCRVCGFSRERSGVPDIAARKASGHSSSSWCWCGEKPDHETW